MVPSDPRRRKRPGARREEAESRRQSEPEQRDDSPPEDSSDEPVIVEVEQPEADIESPNEVELDKRLTEEEEKRSALEDRIRRLQAEFDNYRKRQAREFHRLCSEGKKKLIEELLGVLDNLYRAQGLHEEGHSAEEILPGMLQVLAQIRDILQREGLERLEVEEMDDFDPNIHEAMLAEDREDLERDAVLEVFQDGYMLEQELLRPARVKVGKASAPKADSSNANGADGGEAE